MDQRAILPGSSENENQRFTRSGNLYNDLFTMPLVLRSFLDIRYDKAWPPRIRIFLFTR